jgi:hypothetical protein
MKISIPGPQDEQTTPRRVVSQPTKTTDRNDWSVSSSCGDRARQVVVLSSSFGVVPGRDGLKVRMDSRSPSTMATATGRDGLTVGESSGGLRGHGTGLTVGDPGVVGGNSGHGPRSRREHGHRGVWGGIGTFSCGDIETAGGKKSLPELYRSQTATKGWPPYRRSDQSFGRGIGSILGDGA